MLKVYTKKNGCPDMKDYARKNEKPVALQRHNRYRQDATPVRTFNIDRFLLWTITLSLFGAVTSGLYTFHEKSSLTMTKPEAALVKADAASAKKMTDEKPLKEVKTPVEKKTAKAEKVSKLVKAEVTAQAEPKYDFYQVLPKMTVDVTSSDDDRH